MIKTKIYFILFIFAASLHTGCCVHRSCPMLPKAWNADECNVKSLEDNFGQPKLHVLVMYNEGPCSHVALRLFCQEKGPIFWDPAGGFANDQVYEYTEDQEYNFNASSNHDSIRLNDVIIKSVPSINQYLVWRKFINTHAAEIFEFNIAEAKAEELWTILRDGTKRSHPKGKFHTKAIGGTCGLSIAKFLHRFAEDIVEVDTVFFPHNLSKQLYKQNPDRIISYRDEQLYSYIPPEDNRLVSQKEKS